jgi:NAD-dependent deacetylase
MGVDAKLWAKTLFKGVGQVAFCDRALQGGLILAAIAWLSPYAAAWALGGAALGTVLGRLLRLRPDKEWREGLAGVNAAIAGLFAAWLFPDSAVGLACGLALVLVTLAFDAAARPVFRRAGLPDLSFAAVATVFAAWGLHQALGLAFWPTAPLPPLTIWLLAPSAILIGAALRLRSNRGALTAFAFAGAAMVISGHVYGFGAIGPIGLWVFTVAPIAFAAHGVFMAGAWRGVAVAAGASALGTLLWLAWVHGPLVALAPPLTVPMLVALWAAALFCRWRWGPASQIAELWYVAERIRAARQQGKPVVALTGAGISTASGIPDYVSGAWFEPDVPISTYGFSRFLASSRCRRAYWDSCRRFLDVATAARPNPGHVALAELQRRGAITAIVTQNVDALHQSGGAAEVVELHGTIGHVWCLDCSQRHEWPPGRLWQRFDLRCTSCNGLLKPAVIALGESIPIPAWRAARRAVKDCGVMLVVGSQLAISSAAALVAEARAEGALVVFLNLGPAFAADFKADIAIAERVEEVLPALAVLLDGRMTPPAPEATTVPALPAPAAAR